MQVVYDYIVTSVIFLLIFTFSMASILNIVEMPMRHLSQLQLSSVAETVFGSLLGYAGDPEDWGSNIELQPKDLKVVGLSKSLKSDVIYTLDMDKLSRLLPRDTGATIGEDMLYGMLNLGNEYGFSLQLTPVLNISVMPTAYVGSYASKFLVKVTTHEMTPVGNVVLTVYILTAYYDKSEKLLYFVTNETKSDVTKWDGSASFDYTSFMTGLLIERPPAHTELVGSLLVVLGDFYEMKTVAVFHWSFTAQPVIEGIVLGKNLIFQDVKGTKIEIPKGAKHKESLTDSAECTFGGVIVTAVKDSERAQSCPWLTDHDNKHFQILELTYLEPDIFWVALVAKTKSDYGLIVFPRIPGNLQVGSKVIPRGTRVVGIRRVVFVESLAYFADFYFWSIGH